MMENGSSIFYLCRYCLPFDSTMTQLAYTKKNIVPSQQHVFITEVSHCMTMFLDAERAVQKSSARIRPKQDRKARERKEQAPNGGAVVSSCIAYVRTYVHGHARWLWPSTSEYYETACYDMTIKSSRSRKLLSK